LIVIYLFKRFKIIESSLITEESKENIISSFSFQESVRQKLTIPSHHRRELGKYISSLSFQERLRERLTIPSHHSRELG